MTEQREATETCIMGSKMEHPCTYPATEPIRQWNDGVPVLCAFHAATEPLADESDEMGVCLELVRAYLQGARKSTLGPLVEALERIEADFSGRLERADKVLDDLQAAEFKLMRS